MRRKNIGSNDAKLEESPYNVQSLAQFSDDREAEIERMCNNNHQDFVQSVNQLLSVRKGTYDLTSEILRLNQTIQASTEKLVEQKKALVDSRDGLRMCLEVLRLANRVRELLASKSHYPALRTLDELQNVHLKEVLQFNLAEVIQQSVPAMQRMIKDAVMSDLNTWLYRIRETSRLLGEVAFDQTELRRRRQQERVKKAPYLRAFKLNSAIELVLDETEEYNVLDNDRVQIDFTPLFECLHIYDALGERDEFRLAYADTRQQQKELLLNLSPLDFKKGEEEDISPLSGFLEQIAGFAILERATVRKTANFRSQMEVDVLWESMCKKAIGLIQPAVLSGVNNADTLFKIKGVLAIFIQTMDSWEYNVDAWDELLLTLFNKYSDLLKVQFSEDFKEIVSTDDYMPMAISSLEDWDNVVSVSWYKPDKDREQIQFPCVFPFSKMYPLCCLDIRNFLNKSYRFSDDYFRHHTLVDDRVQSALDDLLCNQVCKSLVEKLESKYLGQIVQILINIEHFEFVCRELEKLLAEARTKSTPTAGLGAATAPVAIMPLRATATFLTSKKTAEKRIFELVNSKIDDLVETADYDFLCSTPQSAPSLYLQEMTRFLSNIMNSTLLGLPRDIKGLVYFDALSHLASSVLKLPLQENVKAISRAAVEGLEVDVRFLLKFVESLPGGVGAGTGGLPAVFEELRQTVELLVKVAKEGEGAAEEFYDVGVRMRKYAAVDPLNGPVLVEKVVLGASLGEKGGEGNGGMSMGMGSKVGWGRG
ncbi:exocyst complex subunit Sec15-like-domain-containing protein [Kalaharituber pfeilii]|nr:exocyst complex subunit Sec15-like-domain-containing protein [Kalaharituber pfeilii]